MGGSQVHLQPAPLLIYQQVNINNKIPVSLKKMENNKYYTPNIEQFVVGFEYELQDDKGNWLWNNTPQDKKLLKRMIKDGKCRALVTLSI